MKKLLFLALIAAPFITRAQDGYMRTPKGAQYKIITHNTGNRIKLQDVITLNMTLKTEHDSVLFNSYAMGHPMQVQVQPSQNVGDLMDVFPLLTVKDSAIVRVPADSVYAGHEDARPPALAKGSIMVFFLKIEKVQSVAEVIAERNAAQAQEKAEMDKLKTDEGITAAKYIAEHKLNVKTTPSGLKYVITHASARRKVMPGDSVYVNYAGRTTDDKLFDSSIEAVAREGGLQQPGRNYEPLPIVVAKGQVIKGWDEGLLLLNEGSKATFVIPSNLGYGDQGAGGSIKPYSTLIFDVEVVKVIPGKAKAKPAAKPGVKKGTAAKTPAKKTGTPVKSPATKKATTAVKK